MWRPVVVTDTPTEEPLTLDEAKAHLRVDASDDTENELIGAYLAAARGFVESWTSTRLVTQTVELRTDDWADLERLPVAPLSDISSIAYTTAEGDPATLDGAVYEARLEGLEPLVVLKSRQVWPSREAGSLIVVTAQAGYGDAGAQPPEVLAATRLVLGDLYSQRESVAGTPTASAAVAATVEALLHNHRLFLI